MNRFKRLVFQVVLWLVIWSMIWISGNGGNEFIFANAPAFLFQILLLYVLIYLGVPKLLFKNKYLLFFIVALALLLGFTFLASELGPTPQFERPPFPEGMGADFPDRARPPLPDGVSRPPGNIPSRFLIHFLILAVSCVTAILLETFIFAQKKEKSGALTKAELMESELKFLKMQINPHFLFNALNNIYSLSVTNSERTQESIGTLSSMLRYVIYDCEQTKVPLSKEIDYITNYIEMFQLKSSKMFNITFDKHISDPNTLVAPMLFVPYIENAFKHGALEKGEEYFVNISLKQNHQDIELVVENKIPVDPAITDSQGGVGIPNVQKRLDILYPQAYQLDITQNGTFKVHLILKLQ